MWKHLPKHSVPNSLVTREPALVEAMAEFRSHVHDLLLDALAARRIPESVFAAPSANTLDELLATAQILRVLTQAAWNREDLTRFDAYWREASACQAFGDEFEAERFRIRDAISMAYQALLVKERQDEELSISGRHAAKAKLNKPASARDQCPRVAQPTLFGMKTYHGRRTGNGTAVVVEENGERRALDPRLDLGFLSPAGFEWSGGGSGPAQLALALAADVLDDDAKAQELYPHLKRHVIARLPHDGWTLTEDELRQTLTALEQAKSPGR